MELPGSAAFAFGALPPPADQLARSVGTAGHPEHGRGDQNDDDSEGGIGLLGREADEVADRGGEDQQGDTAAVLAPNLLGTQVFGLLEGTGAGVLDPVGIGHHAPAVSAVRTAAIRLRLACG
ncbi:hypothetical protein GCM10009864_70850 [Streptomyces lunalinharesii]|uniref:Uncharacterized protein n=1 Tax=Streptomyces lunalinharesii TaxID=333384 RepID=A0ABN3SX91_9ACTN